MAVLFDGVELISTTYMTRFVKHESAPERNLVTHALAREDGEVLITERRGRKVIQLSGLIRASSQSALETAVDSFKELFSRSEKNLDIDWAGGTRRYVATCRIHNFDRDHYHLSVVPWTAEFVVLSGVGTDTTATEAFNDEVEYDNTDDGTGTFSFTVGGSAPPLPTITIVNSYGTFARGIEVKNTDTGERMAITYPGNWGDNRTIVIDYAARTVTGDVADGVSKPLNMYGVFPSVAVGTNNFQILVGGIINQKSADDDVDTDTENSPIIVTAGTSYDAQGFMVPTTDTTFRGVRLALAKGGSSGTYPDLLMRIETDNNGEPSGTLVDAAATDTILAASLGTSRAYVESVFSADVTLQANTRYWLVQRPNGAFSGDRRFFYYIPKLATYPRGFGIDSGDSGSSWNPLLINAGGKTDLSFALRFGGIKLTSTLDVTVSYVKRFL